MKAIITGAYGFIGSYVAEIISNRGGSFVVIDAGTIAAVNEDLVVALPGHFASVPAATDDPEAWKRIDALDFEPDVVLHLAAETHVDRSIGLDPTSLVATDEGDRAGLRFLRGNVEGTMRACAFAAAKGIPLVHVSTDEVYGDAISLDAFAALEDDPDLDPSSVVCANLEGDSRYASSPYSASKVASEVVVEAWIRTFGTDARIVRPSNAFGARQIPDKLVPVAIAHLCRGNPVPLYAGGGQIRQWIHARDIARGIILAAINGTSGGVYNLGGDDLLRNRDLVEIFAAEIGGFVDPSQAFETVGDRPGHDLAYRIDSRFALDALGWKPTISVWDSISELVESYG